MATNVQRVAFCESFARSSTGRCPPRNLRQYCRYCLAVLPPACAPGTGPRSPSRAAYACTLAQLFSVSNANGCARAETRRCAPPPNVVASNEIPRGESVAAAPRRSCSFVAGDPRNEIRMKRGEAECRSASRWQYCQAVSAVLPEVARRHPALPRSRDKPYLPYALFYFRALSPSSETRYSFAAASHRIT